MKSSRSFSPGRLVVWLVVVCIIVGFGRWWLDHAAPARLLATPVDLGSALVVGELTAGKEFRQPLRLPAEAETGPFFLDLRFATYLRRNASELALTLEQGSVVVQLQRSARGLADGAPTHFYIPAAGWHRGPANLRLRGDGTQGTSPTVWAIPAADDAPASVNGVEQTYRLAVGLRSAESVFEQFHEIAGSTVAAWGLLIAYALGIATLLTYSWRMLRLPRWAR